MSKKKNKVKGPIFVRATSYDSSRFQPDMDWKWADSKSVDASLTHDVRKRIRERARYEIANNAYASGAGMSISTSVIPNQPRLQFSPIEKTKRNDKIAAEIESDFEDWAKEVKLGSKLRSMRFAKYQDGESFAVLHENLKLSTNVKLDFSPIDCDRVTNLGASIIDPRDIDGVKLDEWGNPVSYNVLDYHPGDIKATLSMSTYSADKVLHWFRQSTPEQHRGVSEISSSLMLFSFLRRYTYSVVRASEVAADMALILKTNDVEVDDSDEIAIDNPIVETPFSRGMVSTMPEGFEPMQLKAEQPTAQFNMLIEELLGAIGSSIGIPRLMMRKTATGFTYASAKVDISEMDRFVNIERDEMNSTIMRPLFRAFLKEWELVNNKKAPKAKVNWFYTDSIGTRIDPLKEANAQATRLKNCCTSLATEYAKQGLDWQQELKQIAAEQAFVKQLNISYGVTDDPNMKRDTYDDETTRYDRDE